jgi:hypothetical protein
MSRSTISTFQLFEMFPDEETARKFRIAAFERPKKAVRP